MILAGKPGTTPAGVPLCKTAQICDAIGHAIKDNVGLGNFLDQQLYSSCVCHYRLIKLMAKLITMVIVLWVI